MRIHEELRSSEQNADGGQVAAETTDARDTRATDNGRHLAHVNGERRSAGLDAFHRSNPMSQTRRPRCADPERSASSGGDGAARRPAGPQSAPRPHSGPSHPGGTAAAR